ncbi:MAG TPA: GspH/FimT family pseudopilin [Candidatus Binatia bacterium]
MGTCREEGWGASRRACRRSGARRALGGGFTLLSAARASALGERGASLIETVVAVALVGVVLGVAWPSLASYREAAELRAATLRLAAAMARGRTAALTEGRTWLLRLDGPRRFVLSPLDESLDAPPEELPPDTFVADATSGGDVRFFPSGLADNATFTLGAGDQRRRVIVNQRGRITVE